MVYGPNGHRNPMLHPEDCATIDVAGQSVVVTTDLIPLVGVDPYIAGRIAALHSLSDIYACGGSPRWAVATLIVNADHPDDFNDAVLGGLLQACLDEQTQLCGGQTIVGRDAMMGLTVIGFRSTDVALGKTGSRPGDRILLSKPLGVGMIVRAYRMSIVQGEELAEAIRVMTTSNRSASEKAVAAGVRASTDVTGFGLLGHVAEMLGAGQGARLDLSAIPVLDSAASLPVDLPDTHWTDGNLEYAQSRRRIVGITDSNRLMPLLDPQTNGGLLVTASPETAAGLVDDGYYDIGSITELETIDLFEST